MGTQPIGLRDVSSGRPPSRLRLLAPIRYLFISHPEKDAYDIVAPFIIGVAAWVIYWTISPKPPLFGVHGVLTFARDLLIMAVPFMIGALAAVAMGAPGQHIDKRPAGANIVLDGRTLTLRQFVCYLLGYLSFLGLVALGAIVLIDAFSATVLAALASAPFALGAMKGAGTLLVSFLLSALGVTVFWALYFLTDIVNRTE